MWVRWFCNNGVGMWKQSVLTISGYSHSHVGRFHPFASISLGLEGSVMQCHRGGQGKASPLSDLLNVMKRSISSSTFASMSADSGSNSCSTTDSSFFVGDGDNKNKRGEETISSNEAKRLMRLVNVEALKSNLANEGKEVISYSELLEACENVGVTKTPDEAAAFARALDDAGVLLLFRNKVYLHPDKVVDLVRRAVPLALTAENDPTREELKRLQQQKEEIDVQAHKQVRRMLWGGLTLFVAQIGLFFRLTFWEFSWDVMEPIAFFTTTSGLVIGYAYFMFTSRDPTYLDLMQSLFLSRQRKLLKKTKFDIERFKELQKKSSMVSDASTSIKNRVGVHLNLEDALHKD